MLTLFTDVSILCQVERQLMMQLLSRFTKLASYRNPLPDARPQNDHFCPAFAERCLHPETLPPYLVQALTEIEAMVAAKAPAAIEANIDAYFPTSSRLNNAIRYWLLHPTRPLSEPKSPAATPTNPPTQVTPKLAPPSTNPSIQALAVPAPPINPTIQESTNPSLPAASPPVPAAAFPQLPSISPLIEKSNNPPGLPSVESPAPVQQPIQESSNPAAPSETEAETFRRLALLTPAEYDRVRRAEAKRLRLRIVTLDEAVDDVRNELAEARASTFTLPQLEPWPEPITDAPALFDEVHDRFLRYLHLPPGAAVVLTLWPAHAIAINAFTHTPRLNFTSTGPGCGKSTVLELLAAMCPRALHTANMSPAVLYRVSHQHQPTLLLDELDTYLHLYPELRGLLNAANSLDSCVYRCERGSVRAFKTFSATALAGLGHLPATLRDRSIVIGLTKAPAGALKVRFDKRSLEAETILGRKMVRCINDRFAGIAACDPLMPPEAFNRLGDNWRALFACAQIIGGHWPQRILEAFFALNPTTLSDVAAAPPALSIEELDHLLLGDICAIFARTGAKRIFTSTLAEALRGLPDRPWAGGAGRGKEPLSEKRLARRLAVLGIRSHTIRIGALRARGYKVESFRRG